MLSGLSGNLRGGALMAAAAVLFAAEALAIRWMTARGVPVEVQVFFRSLGQLFWVAPMIAASGLAVFRTARPGLHLLRGASSLLTWGFYYASFGPLDLATATVLSFTNVMFTTLLAGPVLGERVDRWRWAGTIAGFIGVAVMLRPGTTVSAFGVALALASAITWCGITLSSRVLAQIDRNTTIMAWVGLVTTAGSLPFAIAAWVPLGLPEIAMLLAVAGFAPGIIWLITSAYRHGEASAIAPFQYLRLIVVALFGWAVFHEVPDGWTWLGAAVILGGAVVVTIAEARRR
ncbi:drug/metabolite transporter (DMT)-like permease [Roseomonas alkaliterrae]|uniref:Drug/metabolite transporter (DMT)-like permease n=1 Tax=Neoroseomonas alkaliterrae TaxID=1452450 RepID=A0A840Y6C1_9PROT|nr:DMT family transporter [Neoroseomonas alkaliterrae]MBB5689444.1 drug/metabolite transporter (DMT)-like permease [Neoroseomonas alkaliterrae]